jgi:hypothetical protein
VGCDAVLFSSPAPAKQESLLVKGAPTRTSLACEVTSGSLTREPGSDIYIYIYNRIYIHIYIIGQRPARDTPHTDEFDSLEPEPSRTGYPDSYVYGHLYSSL